jgi:hypothetical protein
MVIHCWWDCKLVQLLWKTVWRLLKKLKEAGRVAQVVEYLLAIVRPWVQIQALTNPLPENRTVSDPANYS